jgi:cell wall-associated NlpC family hydrolase
VAGSGFVGSLMKNAFSCTKFVKAVVVTVIVLCLLFALGAVSARADCEGAATVTASALNMRSAASTSSSIVTCLPKGTVVLVTGSQDGWYQVWYNGSAGYMSADYVSFSTTAQSSFGTGTVTGNAVRIRSDASTDSSILDSVSSGTTLSVTGVNGAWYQVSYNGSTAYINSAYLSLSGSSASSATTSTTTSSTTSDTGTINATYVRLRSGPSTSHSILGTYNTGTVMTVLGTQGDWYHVRYNGTEGYVYKPYLTLGTATTTSSSFTVTDMTEATATVISPVHMRTGPDSSYTSQRVLQTGESVTITGSSGKWYRVSYNGSTGYVFGTYLSTGSSASSTGSTSEGERLVAEAKNYLGVSYVYGGTSPSGFDCSGFVYYVYRQCGYSITRTATSQNSDGTYVSRENLQPGDIVIFYNSAKTAIGHCGMYIGNGQFIHASSGSGKVVISNLSDTYYNTHYYSARRVVS